ncbi:hypothetical protein H072_10158 [Dactylellina haptotyla CBS 200.50]|uniref:Pre-rRNA-processing protein RIX1 n=1 Tax=Dactylellina haptotyla (strain CBS 200.50) TaxID=1284197 RepID=S8A5I3_DACHA|nr:hypothetical protein H072_10158 [Dactylellina haptotyla CBS 200.50]
MERVVSQLSAAVAQLASVPDKSLHTAVALPLDLLSSSPLLDDASALVQAGGRHSAEASLLLHKLKTRISSLLQSRVAPARWAGVCLVKAGVESSPSFLQNVAPWMPMLLKMVARPEFPTERAIATLTRIFVLTTSKPALTRELTSPHLPTFCQHLLALAASSQDHILPVLHSIAWILRTHPTTFRPQHQKTLDLVRSILLADDDAAPDDVITAATAVHVALVRCAQPRAQGEEWVKLFRDAVDTADRTCDVLFQSVIEEKDVDSATRPIKHGNGDVDHLLSPERIGIRRVRILLGVIEALLAQPASSSPPPSIPLSPLLGLLDRLFAVHPLTKPNPASPPASYHLLLSAYPAVLRSAVSVLSAAVSRLSGHCPSLALQFLHPLSFAFNTSKHHSPLRAQLYAALSHCLALVGRTLSQKDVHPLLETLSAACEDIIPPPPPVIITKEPVSTPGSMLLIQPASSGSTSTYKKRKAPAPQNKANTPAASSMHADQFLKGGLTPSITNNTDDTPLVKSAKTLLTAVILNIPSASIPSETRSKIERTMVLSGHTPGLLAAVLYPATKKRGGSLLPHLMAVHARDIQDTTTALTDQDILLNMAVEGTLHPRMQAVKPVNTNFSDDRSSILSSPVDGRFWAGSPQPTTASLDEVISQPEVVDIAMSTTTPEGESYPEPPPAPVPQHAKLPASPKGKAAVPVPPPSAPPVTQSNPNHQQPAGAMSPPPSIPASSAPRNGTNGTGSNGTGDSNRNMFMPMPSPGRGVHAALPPSPLRQSMSIFEAEDERADGKLGREGKRVKMDDGRSPLGMGVLNRGSSPDADDSDDDDADIPEIIMGSDEE